MAEELKRKDDRQEPGWGARVLMALSALFVATLFAFMIWQAIATPENGHPRAEIGTIETLPDGDRRVEVVLRNDASHGLREVVVEVDCETPGPEIVFTNVPAQGRRIGYVVCPPGGGAPEANVVSYAPT